MRKGFAKLSVMLAVIMIISAIIPVGGIKTEAAPADERLEEGLMPVVDYDMSFTEDGKLKDVSGSGLDASVENLTKDNVRRDGERTVLDFSGTNGYVKIPEGAIPGESFTIHTVFKPIPGENSALYTLGTKNPENYVRLHPTAPEGFLFEVARNGSAKSLAKLDSQINRGEYNSLTTVFDNGKATLYLNGVMFNDLNYSAQIQEILTKGVTDPKDAVGYIGRSMWDGDPRFSGKLERFSVYGKVLDKGEVRGLSGLPQEEEPKLVADYEMAFTSDGKLQDKSGENNHADVENMGGSNVKEDEGIQVLDFEGTNGYVKLPRKVISGESFTICATFKANKRENSSVLTLGTSSGAPYLRVHPSTANGFLFELTGSHNGVIKLGEPNQYGEGGIRPLAGAYSTLALSWYESGLLVCYLNGSEMWRTSHSLKIQDILKEGNPEDPIGYIGRSPWDNDPLFTGKLASFKIYSGAMEAEDLKQSFIDEDYVTTASSTRIVSNRVPMDGPNVDSDKEWREGMVTGNGNNGVINLGYPYNDTLIYQNMYLIFPNRNKRENKDFVGLLEENRQKVMNMDDTLYHEWRSGHYCYHPGPQLRLAMAASITDGGNYRNYERWTDMETAEVGVSYTNNKGDWERKTFTSREDDVTITEIKQSSDGAKVSMELSLDDLSTIPRFREDQQNMQYKKIVADDASYIALVGKYPGLGEYRERSELADGGYIGSAKVVVVGGTKEKISRPAATDAQNVGEADPRIRIKDAEAVYIIECTDRTWDMCKFEDFKDKDSFELLDELNARIDKVIDKYDDKGGFDYEAALAPHAQAHSRQFNEVKFSLNAPEEERKQSVENLLADQRTSSKMELAMAERAYNMGRYIELCCSGYSAPRLYGMWTGEWNAGWSSQYTMDANVNLQVSPMNTGHLEDAPLGYINFILRQLDDWRENAYSNYRMHDAIQVPVNTDGDRALNVESDTLYPFAYWNGGASWLLLPIYEYWQCNGNRQISIDEKYVDLLKVRKTLGVNDGGLSEQEANALIERGWLDLEKDILLPLLTKQANFWEQLMTPEYYMDAEGNPHYEKGKTELDVAAGERYMIIPSYSPENGPRKEEGTEYTWNRPTAMNATMDIAAAKDGLDMTIAMEKAVKREGYEEAVKRWENLKSLLPEYQYDGEPGSEETYYGGGGALREWATPYYMEENRHRHISHLYVAWPGYETQHDEELTAAAKQAVKNRDRLNSGGEKTTGHGWMHYGLIEARLKNPAGVYQTLYEVLKSDIYYTSMVTDHNTYHGKGSTYCTDTSVGLTGVINESLLFSNTGEIELLPALPEDWKSGEMNGLMARTRAEVDKMSWNVDNEESSVEAEIRFDADQEVTLGCGLDWKSAKVSGAQSADVENGQSIALKVKAGDVVKVTFTLGTSETSELEAAVEKAQAAQKEAEAARDKALAAKEEAEKRAEAAQAAQKAAETARAEAEKMADASKAEKEAAEAKAREAEKKAQEAKAQAAAAEAAAKLAETAQKAAEDAAAKAAEERDYLKLELNAAKEELEKAKEETLKAKEEAQKAKEESEAAAKKAEEALAALNSQNSAGNQKPGQNPPQTSEKPIRKGDTWSDGKLKYRVTSADAKTVTVTGSAKAGATFVTIPATVEINRTICKVTAINKNAFKGNKKLRKAVIGKNVKGIGSKAFYKCGKLKKVTVKATGLISAGKGAFKGIAKKTAVKVPKKKVTAYSKLLRRAGLPKTAKVK